MYVCMVVCINVYMNACMHACMYVCMHIWVCRGVGGAKLTEKQRLWGIELTIGVVLPRGMCGLFLLEGGSGFGTVEPVACNLHPCVMSLEGGRGKTAFKEWWVKRNIFYQNTDLAM